MFNYNAKNVVGNLSLFPLVTKFNSSANAASFLKFEGVVTTPGDPNPGKQRFSFP